MTAEPSPAPKRSNLRLPLILGLALLGLIILCTVLNVIGNKANSVPATPPVEQTAAWETAIAHLGAVATKWSGPTAVEPVETQLLAKPTDQTAAGPFTMFVTNVETAPQYGDQKAAAGNQFVAVTIYFASNTEGGLYIGPESFSLKDSAGSLYRTTKGKTPWLTSPILLAKDKTMDILVSFEVPQGARGLVVTFTAVRMNPPVIVPISLGM